MTLTKNRAAEARLSPQGKLALHSQFADYMAGKKVYPVNVEISPCGWCNASCEWCWFANTGELGSHRKIHLKADVLLRLISDCASLGVKSVSWTGGGEPSLHPQIGDAVRHMAACGMEQGMFTNALAAPRYDPGLLSWIRVTMTNKPYRPEHIRPLRAAKTLGFAFNYSGPRDDDYLMETLKVAHEVGADYVQLRPALACHGETVDITPPQIDDPLLYITDYKFEQAKKKHSYKQCEGFHFIPFVWENGDVDVCAYMRKHEGYTLGNLYKQSFKEILDAMPPSVPVHSCCQVACKLHEINLLIHQSREIEDKNFP